MTACRLVRRGSDPQGPSSHGSAMPAAERSGGSRGVTIHRGRAVASLPGTGTIRIPARRTPSRTPPGQVAAPLVPPDARRTRPRGHRRLRVVPRGGHLESSLVLTVDLLLLAGLCAFGTA